MGKLYEKIDEKIKLWISQQPVFFVATAPLSPDGHVNCSPKDGFSIRVLDERTLAYLDLVGSGIETLSHLRENGRIVLMMCAFSGPPRIMRFHGRGEIIEQTHPDYRRLMSLFDAEVGIRSFVRVHLDRISDSCGFGVPLMEFKEHRPQLRASHAANGEEKLIEYQRRFNSKSIDGLPGVKC